MNTKRMSILVGSMFTCVRVATRFYRVRFHIGRSETVVT